MPGPAGLAGSSPLACRLTPRLAWQAGMPTFVQSPPVLVSGGILVQPADLAYACAAAR